jgi:N-acetylmuramic acid 6-phosphate etherase
MVRLGKTYGTLMVDLQPNSRKLRARARRIVAQACHISDEEAAEALAACQGEVKAAIVSTLARCSADEARQRLVKAGGTVRQALVM